MSRQFPIQVQWPERDYPPQRRSIPWDLIAPHEKQALENHCGQTLQRLADRMGLSSHEAVAIIEDKRYTARWKTTNGTTAAQHTQTLEAINRLEELCREFEEKTKDCPADRGMPLAELRELRKEFDTCPVCDGGPGNNCSCSCHPDSKKPL